MSNRIEGGYRGIHVEKRNDGVAIIAEKQIEKYPNLEAALETSKVELSEEKAIRTLLIGFGVTAVGGGIGLIAKGAELQLPEPAPLAIGTIVIAFGIILFRAEADTIGPRINLLSEKVKAVEKVIDNRIKNLKHQ